MKSEIKIRNNPKDKENKKATKNVASMIMYILTDIIDYSNANYLNVSYFDYYARHASVASMVMHSSHKRGPDRHPGSIPGWGGLAINFSLVKLNKSKPLK